MTDAQGPFQNIYEAERAIQELIEKDNHCSAHFNYGASSMNYSLDLVTYNPKHKKHFLLHTTNGKTRIQAANRMYKHLTQLKESIKQKNSNLLNYTVEWYNYADDKSYHSSFYSASGRIEEIVKKVYYGKTRGSIIIHSIKLNPIS